MVVSNRNLSSQLQAIAFILGAALLSPAFAAGKNLFFEEPSKHSLDKLAYDKALTDKENEDALEQTINHNFSPEDRNSRS